SDRAGGHAAQLACHALGEGTAAVRARAPRPRRADQDSARAATRCGACRRSVWRHRRAAVHHTGTHGRRTGARRALAHWTARRQRSSQDARAVVSLPAGQLKRRWLAAWAAAMAVLGWALMTLGGFGPASESR